jgi:hypothetical protein
LKVYSKKENGSRTAAANRLTGKVYKYLLEEKVKYWEGE